MNEIPANSMSYTSRVTNVPLFNWNWRLWWNGVFVKGFTVEFLDSDKSYDGKSRFKATPPPWPQHSQCLHNNTLTKHKKYNINVFFINVLFINFIHFYPCTVYIILHFQLLLVFLLIFFFLVLVLLLFLFVLIAIGSWFMVIVICFMVIFWSFQFLISPIFDMGGFLSILSFVTSFRSWKWWRWWWWWLFLLWLFYFFFPFFFFYILHLQSWKLENFQIERTLVRFLWCIPNWWKIQILRKWVIGIEDVVNDDQLVPILNLG